MKFDQFTVCLICMQYAYNMSWDHEHNILHPRRVDADLQSHPNSGIGPFINCLLYKELYLTGIMLQDFICIGGTNFLWFSERDGGS